jgi:eukaryotic-like serine/threonine-protein kinase
MHPDRTAAERQAAEIIQSWLDGAPPDAAQALRQHLHLAADKTIVLDLAFAEYLIREAKGERLDVEDFCARFPTYHASLGRMLSQQSVQGPTPASPDGAVPDGIAERTLNIPIVPVQSAPPTHTPPGPAPLTNVAVPPSPGSSPTRKSGTSGWPDAGQKVGDFGLLRQLGKGAFGRVFLALEEPTTRHVVVKVSKQKCDEAKVLGKVGHKNVVSVLSAPHDLASGLYLIVMPYHGSATFEDLLELAYPLTKGRAERPRRADVVLTAARRNHHPHDPSADDLQPDPFLKKAGFIDGMVWLGIRLADALAAVHMCGYVHHDLKPSNVLLGLDGQPRLLDFNLASDAQNAKSRLGGTLPYMPPEHLAAVRHPGHGSPVMDVRGDVYSLGVILYELLTGTHPFGRFPKSRSVHTVADEMLARQKMGVRPVRERNPDVPHRLARLVERCLAFEATERPQTAAAVADELRQCYSVKKQALEFLAGRPGRVAITAATVGLVTGATWLATATAKSTITLREDHPAVGMAAFKDGRYADAVPELARATQDSPHDAELWLALGRARVAQGELKAARLDLERAAALRPGHGPSHATLGWCLARLGYHEEAQAAIGRAIRVGYNPAGLQSVKAFSHVQRREDPEAAEAVALALKQDPNNRAALVNRASLALLRATATSELPSAQAYEDVERAIAVGPDDGTLYLWAARFYSFSAHKPAQAKGDWHPDPEKMKEKCLAMLRKAVENGAPADMWKGDSTFAFLFGNPDVFAKDWKRPSKEADPAGYWRIGDPLKEFAG